MKVLIAGEEQVASLRRVMISRIPGLCGVVGPLIFLSVILVTILRSAWFVWTESWLSDLGGTRDSVAALFNLGLIIGGALTAIFAMGLKGTMPGLTRGGVGAIALFLGAVALSCIGIFRSTAGVEYLVHYYTSALLFTLVIISLLLIGSAMMQKPSERSLGRFIFITGLFTCTAGSALLVINELSPWGGAIPEFLISLAASVCYIILGVRLFTRVPSKVRGRGLYVACESGTSRRRE